MDAEAIAASLLEEIGSLECVIAASDAQLERIAGRRAAELIAATRAVMRSALRPQRLEDTAKTADAVGDYLISLIGSSSIEEVHVLFFDRDLTLLDDALIARGSRNSVSVDCRSILQRALEVGSSAIVVAHNHPSGTDTPSREDIAITRRLLEAASALDISLIDHFIVTRYGINSARSQGWM